MFISLKKKLQQGVDKSKAVVTGLAKGDDSNEDISVSDTWTKPMAESTPQKDVRHGKPIVEDFHTPVFSVPPKNKRDLNVSSRQLLSSPPSEGSSNTQYETASDVSSLQGDITPKDNRSRTSSVSSLISDNTFFPSINLSSSISMQSDNESEVEDTSLNLSSASREDLYAFIKRFEQRAFKYKSKFLELAAAYKDSLQERDKLKSALAHCQDDSLRQSSELDQPSKHDLEERYKLLLSQKDEYTKDLQMQIQLLKEEKNITEDLEANLLSKQGMADSAVPTTGGANRSSSSPNEEIELLNARIKRQDGLLQKCKNTITSYKEKIVQLSKDKDELHGKLELLLKAGDRPNSHAPDQVSRLQAQMHEARKVIGQLELDREVAIAEFKQQIHEEMEQKDAELEHVKTQHHKFVGENHNLKLDVERLTTEVEDLRRINQEQLEKARNIMRKLKDDKKLALEQAEARIRQAELSMEEEKEKMLVDLKRGKAEAFSVMQQESEKNLAETVEAAVEERDRFWKKKFAAQEVTHLEVLQAKDREKEMVVATMKNEVRHKMKEKEEDVKLALEERELQKMAALTGLDEQKDRLLLQIEELSSEKIKLSNRFSKFQEDTGHQISELEGRLKQEEAEHNRHIHEMQLSLKETLEKEKSKLLQKVKEEIESLKQRHAEEIQRLADRHEQEMQESNTEVEIYYRNRLESEKVQLENLLTVTRDQLEEMRNCHSLNQTKLMEPELPLNKAEDQLPNRAGNQELPIGIDLIEQGNRSSSQGEEQMNRTENQVMQENCSAAQVKTLEQSNLQLTLECQALSDQLKTVKENLAVEKNETVALKTDNCEHEEGHQQMLGQSEYDKEGSKEQDVLELNKQISELNDELECLRRNAEDSRIKVEDLQRCLEETVMEKKAIECKSREFELQVGQLQEVIRTLESCQNTVEREKESLEQKLTFLENIVEDLKASKEELNEKLHDRHEALVEQFHEEKQAIEQTASEFSSQVNILKEEVAVLNKTLLSKNDENVALRSVVEDNVGFVKSLEATIDKLTAELQAKSQACSQSEAALAKSLDKFEKLKSEANAKVKGLKEIKDSLTEELDKQQRECEDIRSSLLEKDSQIKVYEEKVIKQQEEIASLEQTFKEQFDEHRVKFQDVVDKLKEHHESELKEKEKQFDYKLEGTLQTSSDSHCRELEDNSGHIQQISDLQQRLTDKDSSIQNVQTEIDNVVLQLKEMSDKHKIEIDTLNLQLAEKDVLVEHLASRLESVHGHLLPGNGHSLPEQGESLASQLQSLTELIHEKDKKLESMAGTISAEQESLYKQLSWQTERAEEFHAQKNTLAVQLKEALEKLDAQLQDKEVLLGEVSQKMVEYTSLKEVLQTASNTSPENDTATRSLTDQLAEFTADNYSKLRTLESQLEAKSNSITALEDELNSLRDLHEQELAEATHIHTKEIDILKSDWDSQITELQAATQALKSQLKEANEKMQECIQSYEDKLVEEKFQLETQERLFQGEIMVLKQQLHETKSQASESSSLLQNVKEGEEKLLNQMQDDLKALEHVAEQKMIDLKQKYTSKLKEIQAQAKRTIEELEDTLNVEKAAKSEMYSELTRANTRLLQLEENTGTSKDTIVDLERKVGEMAALIESRDNELSKLRSDMAESERNMQDILEETQVNCKQINDKLTEAETKLKEDESGLQFMNDKLQEKFELSEEKDRIVKNLERKCSELEQSFLQEKERLEQEAEETSKKCIELEYLLEKTKNELDGTVSKFSELDNKFESVSSLSTELQNAQTEKSYLQAELSQLTAEKEELKSKLLVTDSTFEKSLKDHASLVRDLEIKRSEIESKRDEMKQGYEAKLNQLQQAHAADLLKLETQNSTKIAKCKKKSETYVSEMRRQYQEEYNILFDKQQENITKLEDSVAILTREISELKHSKEIQAAESESLIQDLKSRVEEEIMLKKSEAEQFDQKEQQFEQAQQTLTNAIEKLEEENRLLSDKLNMRCAKLEDGKVQFNRVTTTNEMLNSDEEEELTTHKTELEESTHKSHQVHEQMSEMELGKGTKHSKARKVKDVETMQIQTEGNSELFGQVVSDLRKEVSEKDKHIKELNAEYSAKVQALETEQDLKVHELQSLLTSTRLEYKQRVGSLEAELKVEHQKSHQSGDGSHHQKVVAFTPETNNENKETFGERQTALQEQVTHLTRHMEQIKEQHKLELADMASRLEARQHTLLQPLPSHLNMDALGPNFSPEMHNLELQNMDLQAQVSQLNGELSMYRIKERDSFRKKEHLDHGRSGSDDDDPPLSLDESYMNHTDLAIFREPTEFEYLKNILYEYMMGRETKTLTKVISTVVKFSDEQMKNVLAKADKKVVLKP